MSLAAILCMSSRSVHTRLSHDEVFLLCKLLLVAHLQLLSLPRTTTGHADFVILASTASMRCPQYLQQSLGPKTTPSILSAAAAARRAPGRPDPGL